MSNYCEPLLAALKDCVLHSDCVMKDGKLPSECIKHHLDELPEECRSLRLATFECKRGMVYPLLKSYINTLLMPFLSLTCGNASAEIVQVPLPRGSSKRTRQQIHHPQSYPRLRSRACFRALVVDQLVMLPARECPKVIEQKWFSLIVDLYDKIRVRVICSAFRALRFSAVVSSAWFIASSSDSERRRRLCLHVTCCSTAPLLWGNIPLLASLLPLVCEASTQVVIQTFQIRLRVQQHLRSGTPTSLVRSLYPRTMMTTNRRHLHPLRPALQP